MKKWWYRRILIIVTVLSTVLGTGFAIQKIETEEQNQQVSSEATGVLKVIPGGVPIGIYLETDGIYVLGTDHIFCHDGVERAPAENIIHAGDYITGINGVEVTDKKTLIRCVKELQSDEAILSIRREEEKMEVKVHAVLDENEEYKLGIWVKDNIQGLGTLTFLTEDNSFGALGHGIHDSETDELLEISEGSVYETSIIGVKKGESGNPGGLKGVIVYNPYKKIGEIVENSESGIKGVISETERLPLTEEAMEVASKEEIEIGKATILCTIEDEVEEYEIRITNTNRYSKHENKAIMLEVTDEALIEKTGGIVQGLSGSPIIQNGKLVGAVTHVLVNDPTRGYGIFIEDMLEH